MSKFKFNFVIAIVFLCLSQSRAICTNDEQTLSIRDVHAVTTNCKNSYRQSCTANDGYSPTYGGVGVPEVGGIGGSPDTTTVVCRYVPCNTAYQPSVVWRSAAYTPNSCMPVEGKTKDSSQIKPECGSIIKPESQVLGESIPIVGLPFNLNYFTNRVLGRTAEYKAKFFINGSDASFILTNVSGQPLLTYSSTAVVIKDDFGAVLASANYTVPIPDSYTYQWISPSGLGAKKLKFHRSANYIKNGVPVSYEYKNDFYIGSFRAENLGLGGWFPSNWFYYDINTSELFSPDGNRRQVTAKTLTNGELRVAAEDGSEVYEFNSAGLHLRTRSFLLGSVLYSFQYTASGKLASVIERSGRTTTFNRDASEKWISVTSASNKISQVLLTTNGYLSQITDPLGKTYQLTYQGTQGLLKTFRKPSQELSTFTYDTDGNLISDVHSGGFWYTLEDYSSPPNILTKSITSAEGKKTYYGASVSNANQDRISISTTQNNLGYSDTYKKQTNLETWVNKGVQLERNTYFDTSRFPQQWRLLDYISDNSSGTTRTEVYADYINPSPTTDPWTYTSWQHDRVLQKSPSNLLTRSIFTKSSRTWVTTTPLSNTYTTVLDTSERPISIAKGNLNPVTLTYEMDQIKTIQHTTARTTTFNYDVTTRLLTSIVDPLNQTTSFSYDANERLIAKTLPDNSVITITYDDAGRVIGITPPSRPMHVIGINPMELFGSYTAPTQVTSLNIAYNYDRQPTVITRPSGRTISFNYDTTKKDLTSFVTSNGTTTITRSTPYRRITKLTSPAGFETSFEYSGENISKEAFYYGGLSGYSKKYFQAQGKLSAIDLQIGTGTVSSIAYNYNNDEQLLQVGNQNFFYSAAPNGVLNKTQIGVLDENITTNGFAEVTGRNVMSGSTVLYNETLTRDNQGRIATKNFQVSGWSTKDYRYVYDNNGRLKEVQDGSFAWIRKYNYDNNGNRISLEDASSGSTIYSAYDTQDRLTNLGSVVYSYNTDGELQSRTNTILNQTSSYVYDVQGNLTQVTLENGNIINYEIDGLNRRVSRRLNGTVTHRYLWEQSRLIAELNADGSLKRRYVYATKNHAPDYYVEAGIVYKIVSDQLGSPILVLKASDASVIQRIEYDEFGKVLQDSRSGELAIGYAGGLWDWDTKMLRFGARDYDSTIGRWTSKDPIGFGGGDTNLYAYVGGSPMSYIDPTGLKSAVYDWGNLGHEVLGVDDPSSPTGKTYIDFYPGDSNNVGYFSPSPGKVDISSKYPGLILKKGFNTTPLQDAEMILIGKIYQGLANDGKYKYQALPYFNSGKNVGNCQTFTNDLLNSVGAK